MAEHIFAGACPDETQPESRDANCPACELDVETAKLERELVRERERRQAAEEALRLIGDAKRAEGADPCEWAVWAHDTAREALREADRQEGTRAA